LGAVRLGSTVIPIFVSPWPARLDFGPVSPHRSFETNTTSFELSRTRTSLQSAHKTCTGFVFFPSPLAPQPLPPHYTAPQFPTPSLLNSSHLVRWRQLSDQHTALTTSIKATEDVTVVTLRPGKMIAGTSPLPLMPANPFPSETDLLDYSAEGQPTGFWSRLMTFPSRIHYPARLLVLLQAPGGS